MNKTFNTSQNEDGSYGIDMEQSEINSLVESGNNAVSVFSNVVQEVTSASNMLIKSAQNVEYSIQRYNNAEASMQMLINKEVEKYNSLVRSQNNLLSRINTPEIRIWRYRDQLYYRSKNGQLIIGNLVEIKKELSSRYGGDIHIINDFNDFNDVLNINKVRVNTIVIAINNLQIVEEECFTLHTNFELYQHFNAMWKRNLLAHTRFLQQRLAKYYNGVTDTRKLMLNITENKIDYISQWIGNIGIDVDTILLLIGNKSVSEDLIVQKVIRRLFNTNIVVTITDKMLKKQTLQEITRGNYFSILIRFQKIKRVKKNLKN